MRQLEPAAKLEPHTLATGLTAKLPVATILEMVIDAVPVLFSVTNFGELVVFRTCASNNRLLGSTLTVGAEPPAPVPVRLAVCGLLPALSTTLNVPLRVPAPVGVKVMLIVQLALAARPP